LRMKEGRKMMIDTKECNRDIRTYGDVIRHMTNDELALFLAAMGANIESGIMSILRAKMNPHRNLKDPMYVSGQSYRQMYSFMEHRIDDEEENYGDLWGVENWQDMCQWEWPKKKNFGMDIVY